MDIRERLGQCAGFDWDAGNLDKNWEKHQVAFWEGEEVFFNQPLVVVLDAPHSGSEERYYCLGKTDAGRLLFVVFTVRGRLIRVISARDMSEKERSVFRRHAEEEDSSISE